MGKRLRKKTRLLVEAQAVTQGSSREQGEAPFFGNGMGNDRIPRLGVKRKAVHQKLPKPKHFIKYLEDHPIAAINRLRAARKFDADPSMVCSCDSALDSRQRKSQARQASSKMVHDLQHWQQQQQQQQPGQ